MPLSKSDGLKGVRVALLEARMSGEMSELVRRHGGVPRVAPSVREVPLDCSGPVREFLDRLEPAAPRVVVFLTGVGATPLFQEAGRQSRLDFLLRSLSRATLVCRGPKPAAALKRQGLSPSIAAADVYTSMELISAMNRLDVAGVDVTLLHYGERNDALAGALRGRGALLNELCLYEWQLPDDTQPMKDLIRDIMAGDVESLVFTSQIQGRHLLRVVAETGTDPSLFIDRLNTTVVVAAVGPICRASLEEAGIRPHVVPQNPKMGPLIAALAEHFANAADGSRQLTA